MHGSLIKSTFHSANHPFILAAVKQCIGEDYIVVTSDGFEIKEVVAQMVKYNSEFNLHVSCVFILPHVHAYLIR